MQTLIQPNIPLKLTILPSTYFHFGCFFRSGFFIKFSCLPDQKIKNASEKYYYSKDM